MKTFKVLLGIFFVIIASNDALCQDKIISKDLLPTVITEYLNSNFPNNKILQATVDKELFSKSYEVILSDGISIEFDNKNKLKEISSQTSLPNSVIPKKILNYVSDNFKGRKIKQFEYDDNLQKVELDNGTELEFTTTGEFYKMDID